MGDHLIPSVKTTNLKTAIEQIKNIFDQRIIIKFNQLGITQNTETIGKIESFPSKSNDFFFENLTLLKVVQQELWQQIPLGSKSVCISLFFSSFCSKSI
jgi:hypothetical protein